MRNPDLPIDTNIAIIVYSQTFAQHLSEANIYATISRHYKKCEAKSRRAVPSVNPLTMKNDCWTVADYHTQEELMTKANKKN